MADVKPILPTPLAEQPRLNVTQESKRGSKHACSICGKGFLYSSRLEKHIKEHHSIVKVEKEDGAKEDGSKYDLCRKTPISGYSHWKPIRKRQCARCDFSTFNRKALALHEGTHQREPPLFTCDTCGKGFDRKANFVFHERMHVRRCKVCGSAAPGKQDMCKVCYEEHSQARPYVCRSCGRAFAQKNNLFAHEKMHSRQKSCPVCNKKFRLQTALDRHQLSHSGVPFSCPICREGFHEKGEVQGHLSTHHASEGEEGPCVCGACGQEFVCESDLRAHGKTHEPPFTCGHCGMNFMYKSGLLIHERSHSGEKPHVCPVCLRRFAQKGTLGNHLLTHTGERAHACDLCPLSFPHPYQLRQHERTHHAERPFACGVCGDGFCRKVTLYKHRVRCHGETKGGVAAPNRRKNPRKSGELGEKTETDEK